MWAVAVSVQLHAPRQRNVPLLLDARRSVNHAWHERKTNKMPLYVPPPPQRKRPKKKSDNFFLFWHPFLYSFLSDLASGNIFSQMSVLRSLRLSDKINSGALSLIKSGSRLLFTSKMTDKTADYSNTNGIESKTPFLIGVAGGTASGKVRLHCLLILTFFNRLCLRFRNTRGMYYISPLGMLYLELSWYGN